MRSSTLRVLAMCVAASAVALPATAGLDEDVAVVFVSGLNKFWVEHDDDRCAHRDDTRDGKASPYSNGDKIHFSFIETGDDNGVNCETANDRYFYVKIHNVDGDAVMARLGLHVTWGPTPGGGNAGWIFKTDCQPNSPNTCEPGAAQADGSILVYFNMKK